MWTLGFLILLSLSLGVGAWLLFVWSVKSGQYDDPEGPKYRMLEDEEEGREPRGRAGAGPSGRAPGPGAEGPEGPSTGRAPRVDGRGGAG